MAKFEEFLEDLPLLVEVGLIAIKQGDEDSAHKLFNAVGILDPKNTVRKMGLGLVAMHKLDLATAKKYFQEISDEEPLNYRATTFLGLSYVLTAFEDTASKEEKIDCLKKGTEIAIKVANEPKAPDSERKLAHSILELEKELHEKTAQKA